MPLPAFQADLLADIEARQDDLLRRLDELNTRIEQILGEIAPPSSALDSLVVEA